MKIGNPVDKPALPAQGSAAAADAAAKTAQAGSASAAAGAAAAAGSAGSERQGRAVEHGLDPALRAVPTSTPRRSRGSPTPSPPAPSRSTPKSIADKLISNAQELLTKVKS